MGAQKHGEPWTLKSGGGAQAWEPYISLRLWLLQFQKVFDSCLVGFYSFMHGLPASRELLIIFIHPLLSAPCVICVCLSVISSNCNDLTLSDMAC